MTDDELIARQTRQLANVTDRLAALAQSAVSAVSHMVCIGGPLNDNRLGYSREQLGPFFAIKQLLEDGLGGNGCGSDAETVSGS